MKIKTTDPNFLQVMQCLKNYNRKRILELSRYNEVTYGFICEKTGLSRPAVSNYCNDMQDLGLITIDHLGGKNGIKCLHEKIEIEIVPTP